MVEILPIRSLTDEDAPIFGSLNVNLAKLARSGFPVAPGIVVTAPNFKLRSVLEKFDFGAKEVFKQSLTLVKKEISTIPPPEILVSETKKHKAFFLNGVEIKSVKQLWLTLLHAWFDQIEQRIWNTGFSSGLTDGLDPQVLLFTSKIQGFGISFLDSFSGDVEVLIGAGKLQPVDLKKLADTIKLANKKLLLPFEYGWILDGGVKIARILPYTLVESVVAPIEVSGPKAPLKNVRSAVRVFLDLSSPVQAGLDAGSTGVDGIYIASERIFNLDKPNESFEDLAIRVVDAAVKFPDSPVFLKLADKSEGMGKVRGSLRLLHQKSLFDPLVEVMDFARHKKGLINVHIVLPFVRGVDELLKIKRELVSKKFPRKNSLQIWMEVALPENILNLEDYLAAGVDGVVLNLDELVSYLNGFDSAEEDLVFYKSEILGLLKFLEEGIRLLHKSKVPFIAYGSLTLNSKVLEFLVEKGVWGIVVEGYEAHSIRDLLHQAEKKMVLRRSI